MAMLQSVLILDLVLTILIGRSGYTYLKKFIGISLPIIL